jgi:hypothetical protein
MECSPLDKLRAPKILNMSIFDWVTSLLGAAALGLLLGVKGPRNWALFIVGWVLFGVAAHAAFGVKTMFGYYLGLNEKPDRSKQC